MRTYWALDANKPSTLMSIWTKKVIPEEILNQFTVEDFNIMTRACVGYILNIYSFPFMARMLKYKDSVVKPYSDENQAFKFWLKLRRELVANHSGVLSIKLMLMRCLAKEMNGEPINLKQELKLCDLLPNDSALFLNLKRMGLKDSLELRLVSLPGNIPTPKQVINDCAEVYKRNIDYANKYVNRQLRFVFTSNNYHTHDVSGDIILAATQAYYLKVPFQSPAHLENTFKITLKNHGHKTRKFYLDPSRSRLRQSSTGEWENRIIGINTSNKTNDEDNEGVSNVNTSMGYSSFSELESRMVIVDFIKQGGEIRKKVVALLSVNDDNEFISYIREFKDDCCLQSNLDILEKYGAKKYYKFIALFLNIPREAVMHIVTQLRDRLTPVV